MKILKSLYELTQKEFFDRYANLIGTLFWLGVIAQVISFFTELGIVYNIASSKLLDLPIKLDADTVTFISWGIAITGSGFFEVGLRKFIPYAIRCFLYKRWEGLDRVMSIFILAVAMLLVTGSIVLSYRGSKELVTIASKPEKEPITQANSVFLKRKKEVLNEYRADSTSIINTYGSQIAAIEMKFLGKIKQQESEIAIYTRKEARTGKSYQSRKQVHKGNIAKYESEQGTQIAALQAAKREDLASISQNKRTASREAQNKYDDAVRSIDRRNRTTAMEATEKSNLYGGGLAWFTVLCMVIFILAVVIDEVHKKGSGIVEQVLVNQYDFSPSAWSRFWAMTKEKVQEKVHTKITKWERSIPSPTLPVVQHELFDLGKIKQERILVEVEKLEKGKYVIPSNLDKSQLIHLKEEVPVLPERPKNDLFQDGNFSKNSSTVSEPDEEGRVVVENKIFSPDTVQHVEPPIVEEITPKNTVNIREEEDHNSPKKRTIIKGFKQNNDHVNTLSLDDLSLEQKNASPIVVEKIVEKIVYRDNQPTKDCLHCGQSFTYKSKKKTYCSEKCRQLYWEKKNGKKLKRGRVE